MLLDAENFGNIRDLARGISWNSVSFGRLVEHRVAVLRHMGIGRGAIVAIAHSGSAQFFADLFAVWRLGAAAACLDQTLTDDELTSIVAHCNSPLLLVDCEGATRAVSVPKLDLENTSSVATQATRLNRYPDDPALVLFTSGTSGAAKGVVLSFRALSVRISLNIAAIGRISLTRALVTLPTHFGHGLIGNALTPLAAGGEIVLHPLGMSLARNLGNIIDEHDITFLTSVPALWHLATRHSRPPTNGSLTRVHIGSAPLSAELWSQAAAWSSAEVVNCYGMTETANWIAGASSRKEGIADGLVGLPWGCQVRILDDTGRIRRKGDGELVVRSPAVMSGYLHRSDLTARVMPDEWLRTGDRGRVDDQGRIWLTGRIKDEINRAGFKIQPAEVDLVLERHPSVAEACVFGIADRLGSETVAAAVRLASDKDVSIDELKAWCRARLRKEVVPARWFFVDEIPRTARGKINRNAVRRLLDPIGEAGKRPTDPLPLNTVQPKSSVGEVVQRAWTAVLGVRSFAENLPWDEAGGDSLNSMRLWSHLEEELGVRLPLDALAPSNTPEMLIEAIEKVLKQSPSASPIDNAVGTLPIVFFMPGLNDDVPLLVRFREAFKDKVQFEVINYPTWKEMIAAGGGFDNIVRSAVEQIRTRRHHDVYMFLGCSFGGFVAWEVACRLRKSGETVGLVGLVDSRRHNKLSKPKVWKLLTRVGATLPLGKFQTRRPSKSPISHRTAHAFCYDKIRPPMLGPPETAASLLRRSRRWIADLALHTFTLLATISPYKVLRTMASSGKFLPTKLSHDYFLMLSRQLRTNALQIWRFEPLEASAILFRCEDVWSGSDDYGWRALCNQLTVIQLEGSHTSIYEAPHCKSLCSRFLELVYMARHR